VHNKRVSVSRLLFVFALAWLYWYIGTKSKKKNINKKRQFRVLLRNKKRRKSIWKKYAKTQGEIKPNVCGSFSV